MLVWTLGIILDKVSNQVYDLYNALTMRERLHVSTIRPPDDESPGHTFWRLMSKYRRH
jgi:hypothetical protein